MAKRPQWDWGECAYLEDEVLHVEVSLALERAGDEDEAAALYNIRDYRAEDLGPFSRPKSVRAAVYRAASGIAHNFVSAASRGKFGEEFRSIRRPLSSDDLRREWAGLWPQCKAVAAAVGALMLGCMLGLALRTVLLFLRLLYCIAVPRSLRPPSYLPHESG